MASKVKRSAIPASGYLYQTLVGINFLCAWLDNPGLYEWVQFEADDMEAARGLDDIVVQRSDQLLEVMQVKFTVDPFNPANALSWTWLTERKGMRGKSLLEKWSDAAFKIGLERLADLRLITNRRPDANFAAHLRNGKVFLAALPSQLRSQVEAHIGGSDNATLFFERFEFSHSYQGYESLDRTVSAALESRHTDHLGWLALHRRGIEWSIHRNSPAPDGRITLEVLRSTISERQPRPLGQEFRIPVGYMPPDPEFADAFLEEAESGAWSLRVLWGSPGQGKSTFLSYVCNLMEERALPFIRHHYFLDLKDPSDRFSLKGVAHSLIVQMQANTFEAVANLSDQPENLHRWIAACSEAYEALGKPFFVMVDGLDHVWRENDEEIAPLEALFAQLLPLPPNTTLILGTQRVDQAQLPARLNRYLEPEHWVELPRMRLRSVQAWLETQHEAGIFQTEGNEPLREEFAQLSTAFEHLSEGHPLVLTYTFLALTHINRVLTLQLVQDSAPAPSGDAAAYYKALWQRLSWEAKDALHLMAENEFIWPAGTLERCVGAVNSDLEAEIGHLLAAVDAGLVAFHGSLYVFIAGQPDHQQRVQALLPQVERWLETEAPQYLRWAWLWLYQSRLGNNDALLGGTTRLWAIDALARAYPPHQISQIMEAAAEVAFTAGDYEQAIRKRALKTRINNGLSYQLDDADVLEDCALRLTEDPYPALLLASEVSQSSIAGLHQLAMLYLSLDQTDRASEVQERMRHRINDRIQSGALQTHEYDTNLEQYLEVAAGTGSYEPRRVAQLLRRHGRAEEVFANFLNRASRAADLIPHMEFCRVPMPVVLRRVLEVEAVRTASWAQAKLHEWSEFKQFRKHPLSVCWSLLYRTGEAAPAMPKIPAHEALASQVGSPNDAEFAQYLHFIFFAALGDTLGLRGAKDPNCLGVSSSRRWLNAALDRLAAVAHTCGSILARGESPAFSLVYRLISLERPAGSDHESWSDLRALRKALVLITADLFFLARPRSCLEHVPAGEWGKCNDSELFALEHWRDLFLVRDYRLLHEETVRSHIQEQEATIHTTVQPFNEKGGELTDLCSLATAYGLEDLAERLLAAAYRCAIGYGWRKDWKLPRLLDAVEEVAQHDSRAAVSAIEKLAPIYTEIDVMTEKSGANQSDLARLIFRLMPHVYARYYRFLLDRSEWYEAERSFSALAQEVNLDLPEAAVALAFLWDSQAQQAIAQRRSSNQEQVDALLLPWTSGVLTAREERNDTGQSHHEPPNEAMMPSLESYPPADIAEFLEAVNAAQQYQFASKWIVGWFRHWEELDRGSELLTAIDAAMHNDLLSQRGTELLDLAYALSRKLQGPAKAFRWLIEAHRYRYGWSGQYYGNSDSAKRIALVAQHYPKRWTEFVASSALPIARSVERGCAIPDVSLISLLLKVGEIPRAVCVLETMVEITVEEFEMQPLVRPTWLDGSAS